MLTNGIFWHKKFIVGTSPPPPSPSLLMLAAASPAPWSSSAPSPWASPPISLMSTPISQHHHCHLHLQAAQHVGLLHLLLPFPPMLLEAPGILAGGMGSVWFIWNIKYYLAPDLGPVPHPLCVCVCCGRALHAYPQPTPTYDPAPSCFPAPISVSFCISSSSVLCLLTTQLTRCWTCGHPGSSLVTNSVLSDWFLHEAGAWEKYR